MKATVLIDNITEGDLLAEWGLCVYIEFEGKKVLLDTGASGKFAENARALSIDLSQVDFGILSHAHYDHSDGMGDFFAVNSKAKFFLRESSGENCYDRKHFFKKYIGIKKGTLKKYADRIVYAKGDYTVADGIQLIPHKTAGLEEIGRSNSMYIKKGFRWVLDDYSHEQSLVFDTADGLVIFNSCSHGGADNIIKEIEATYPGKKIRALIGGFHLYRKTGEEVRAFAARVKETGIAKLYTGHCTGQAAFAILKEELGDCVEQLKTGLVMEF